MRSLRARLAVVWFLSLLVAGVVGFLLLGFYAQSSGVLRERAERAAGEACEAIGERFGYFAQGWSGALPEAGSAEAVELARELRTVLAVALAPWPGVEGGFWIAGQAGPLAGSAPAGAVGTLRELVAGEERSVRLEEAGEALYVQVCPVAGPVAELMGFAVARVAVAPGQPRVAVALGGLFMLVLAMTGLLGWAVVAWSRRVGRVAAALADGGDALPPIAPTGEHDLDRIVAALNAAGARLAAAKAEQEGLAARVARSERFAALGRVAAGVAHEVRNPVAAMRLRAENGLAGDDARRRGALEAILGGLGRLERLTAELLTMTQARQAVPAPVGVRAFLDECAAEHGGDGHAVVVEAEHVVAEIDGALLQRALDELLANARRHGPEGGVIRLVGRRVAGGIAIEVGDEGAGVPAELHDTLFEPFVSGRPEGTGLGLAIAREMVAAAGGRIALLPEGPGARFRIEVPCTTF